MEEALTGLSGDEDSAGSDMDVTPQNVTKGPRAKVTSRKSELSSRSPTRLRKCQRQHMSSSPEPVDEPFSPSDSMDPKLHMSVWEPVTANDLVSVQ